MRRLFLLLLMTLTLCAARAESPAEPLFPARGDNGLWGYINAQVEWVIAPQFEAASPFRGDYAVVSHVPEGFTEEDRAEYFFLFDIDCAGIIDRAGNYVLPPEYALDPGYGDGFYGGEHTGIWIVTKYGVAEEERALEGFFDIPSGHFSGLRWVSVGHWWSDSRLIPVYDPDTWLYGYADRSTGEIVIPCQFGGAADPAQFHEGVAVVCYEDEDGNSLGWDFLIDERGNEITLPAGIHPRGTAIASEGLIVVVDEQGLFGYADLQGNIVIEPQFHNADAFSEGLAVVQLDDRTWHSDAEYGYIDSTGQVVLRGYNWPMWDFEDGYAQVGIGEERVYIDREGNVHPGLPLDNGLAWVREKDERGRDAIWSHLVDRNGEQVGRSWILTDGESHEFDEGFQPVHDENRVFCYLDDTGAVAIPGPFTDAEPFKNGLARVRMEGREGYIDSEGNEVYFWER